MVFVLAGLSSFLFAALYNEAGATWIRLADSERCVVVCMIFSFWDLNLLKLCLSLDFFLKICVNKITEILNDAAHASEHSPSIYINARDPM